MRYFVALSSLLFFIQLNCYAAEVFWGDDWVTIKKICYEVSGIPSETMTDTQAVEIIRKHMLKRLQKIKRESAKKDIKIASLQKENKSLQKENKQLKSSEKSNNAKKNIYLVVCIILGFLLGFLLFIPLVFILKSKSKNPVPLSSQGVCPRCGTLIDKQKNTCPNCRTHI